MNFHERSAPYRLWCWAAYWLYSLTPERGRFTRPARWLLQYAGHYAYAEKEMP